MNGAAGAVLLMAAGAAALLYMDNAQANAALPSDSGLSGTLGNGLSSFTGDLNTMFGTADNPNYNGYDANLSAFLYMLRMGESSNRYNVIYGGQTFSDYSHHPNIWVPIPNDPRHRGSTAAGAYQFIHGTWEGLAARLGLVDFSPASQDVAAAQFLTDLGAMQFIEAGDVAGANAQINSTGVMFESLLRRSGTQLQAWFQAAGGALA
ncbi:Glycoside hydrolase [Burkholderia multivorans]